MVLASDDERINKEQLGFLITQMGQIHNARIREAKRGNLRKIISRISGVRFIKGRYGQ